MKYIKKFDSVADMTAALASSTISVLGMAMDGNTPVFNIKKVTPTPPGPDYSEPFYVENIKNEAETLTLTGNAGNTLEIPVEYSTDGTTWSSFGMTGETPLTRTLQPGEKVYLRATADTWFEEQRSCCIFGVSKVGGNIMSLLYGSSFTGRETTFPNGSTMNFRCLFMDTSNEYYVNNELVSASELILPATTLTPQCYAYMFFFCYMITTSPTVLPATILTEGCYQSMFCYCGDLTAAPELPATTLVNSCYKEMFCHCGDIRYIKCLATDISAEDCTSDWTESISPGGTFVKNPNMSNWTTGADGIPSGWTVQDATE